MRYSTQSTDVSSLRSFPTLANTDVAIVDFVIGRRNLRKAQASAIAWTPFRPDRNRMG